MAAWAEPLQAYDDDRATHSPRCTSCPVPSSSSLLFGSPAGMDGGEDSESVINKKEKHGGRLTSGDMGLFTGPHLHEKGRSVYCGKER